MSRPGIAQATGMADSKPCTPLDRMLRSRLLRGLRGLRDGRLRLLDYDGEWIAGDHGAISATLHVHDPVFYRQIAASGSVGAGQTWIDGHWITDDLVSLVRLLVRNRDLLDGMERGTAAIGSAMLRLWHGLRRNTLTGSRRNIAAHYDLGNRLFSLFLSEDLMYSSALWHADDADDALEQASVRKLDAICRALDLKPADRIIEIGTGWGGFALHAAQHYGCHVTTTTISAEQYQLANERVRAAGLQERITLLQQDYRELSGRYDKLVSIEMIEAVGANYLGTYLGKIEQLLADDGIALLQAITIEDHRYDRALRSVDYIKRFVFPGSFIPSIHAILGAKTQHTELALVKQQDFGLSYARTLHAWRCRFLSRRAEVRALGYDERFIRLWEFYLAYCEGGFLERAIGVSHLVLARPGWRGADPP